MTSIAAACSSAGATGDYIAPVHLGKSGTLLFKAPTTGDYVLAVDGSGPVVGGKFTTMVEHIPPLASGTCVKALPITLFSGKATVSGNTLGAANQYGTSVQCGGSQPLKGPQAYYKLALAKGQSIKLRLSPTFNAALYMFGEAACATASQVDTACASAGVSGDARLGIAAGIAETLVFTAPVAGNYVIAVDSLAPAVGGKFTLSLDLFTPSLNGTCATAEAVTLSGGAASLSGDTSGIKDEHSSLTCSPHAGALKGPQVYYQMSLTPGALHRFELLPHFDARMYIFPKSACGSLPSIKAACGSGVSGGTSAKCPAGAMDALYFTPGSGGPYILAVDSMDRLEAGTFTMQVSKVPATTNSTCAKAQVLTLKGAKATATSDTCGATDEYNSLTCGVFGPSSITLKGPQLYYRVTLKASKNYKLSLTTTTRGAVLYVVPHTACGSATAIQAACSSKGITGDAKIAPYAATTTLSFTPSVGGDYLIAVDAPGAIAAGFIACGQFALTVTEGP